ncbi:MAG: class I SAM-dependent methyltransferase [Desulfuromonadaceae bacterium]|nr:class I SAM-dependent methyltransferase [Desulfuromonadaceae bacterium]
MTTEPAEVLHHYNEDHSERSASVIVPYLLQFINPASAIDIGCGPGQWLSVLARHGVMEVTGVDGAHVPQHLRKVDNFIECDLRRFADLRGVLLPVSAGKEKRFDLCVSLEVAEHLPPECAREFVVLLTELSDIILFSAALLNQTGENHVNEQSQEYWVKLFSERNYVCCDLFRKKFWSDSSVNWWYRQNMFLYVQEGSMRKLKVIDPPFYDGNEYVHPEMLSMYVDMLASLEKRLASQPVFNMDRFKRKAAFWKG